ncbi:hypothetical protein [Acidithiobacillus ferrianus]|uniref:hypothetical protein n=1 Tax=Acidithiobacillus ferrianus TaxID=2678518 RepID=UPI0034E488E5
MLPIKPLWGWLIYRGVINTLIDRRGAILGMDTLQQHQKNLLDALDAISHFLCVAPSRSGLPAEFPAHGHRQIGPGFAPRQCAVLEHQQQYSHRPDAAGLVYFLAGIPASYANWYQDIQQANKEGSLPYQIWIPGQNPQLQPGGKSVDACVGSITNEFPAQQAPYQVTRWCRALYLCALHTPRQLYIARFCNQPYSSDGGNSWTIDVPKGPLRAQMGKEIKFGR